METKNIKKISLFDRIKLKIKVRINDFVKKWNNFKISDDYKALKGMLFDILLLGVLANASLIIFNVSFGIIQIISLGSGIWLLREKAIPMITQILSSFTLVRTR